MGAIVDEFCPNSYYFGLGLVHYVDPASSGLFNQVQINHGLLWQRNAISADNTGLDGLVVYLSIGQFPIKLHFKHNSVQMN